MRLLSPLVLHIGCVQCALATGYSSWISRDDCNGSVMSPTPLSNNFDKKILIPKSFHNKSESKIDGTFFQNYAAAIKDTGIREESELLTNNSKI